jgi:hypothetical protein
MDPFGKPFSQLNPIELTQFFERRIKNVRAESGFAGFLAGAVVVFLVMSVLPC